MKNEKQRVTLIVRDIIEILKDELASVHICPECGGDPDEDCLNGKSECKFASDCSHSYKLEKRLNQLLDKLE